MQPCWVVHTNRQTHTVTSVNREDNLWAEYLPQRGSAYQGNRTQTWRCRHLPTTHQHQPLMVGLAIADPTWPAARETVGSFMAESVLCPFCAWCMWGSTAVGDSWLTWDTWQAWVPETLPWLTWKTLSFIIPPHWVAGHHKIWPVRPIFHVCWCQGIHWKYR